jgi:hypothetical protein
MAFRSPWVVDTCIRCCTTGSFRSINDSFSIEAGIDFIGVGSPRYFGFGGFAIGVPVEVMWAFHFSDKFALYGKAGLALELWPTGWCGYEGVGCRGFFLTPQIIGAGGLMFKASDLIVLRAELGYPGLKVGIGFLL